MNDIELELRVKTEMEKVFMVYFSSPENLQSKTATKIINATRTVVDKITSGTTFSTALQEAKDSL